jgi:hypothetical protein
MENIVPPKTNIVVQQKAKVIVQQKTKVLVQRKIKVIVQQRTKVNTKSHPLTKPIQSNTHLIERGSQTACNHIYDGKTGTTLMIAGPSKSTNHKRNAIGI